MAGQQPEKGDWRRRATELRRGLPRTQVEAWSREVAQRVLALKIVREAGSVFCYVAAGKEVQTRPIIEGLLRRGQVVAVPRVVGAGRMEARRIESLGELGKGHWGIGEPGAEAELLSEPAVALVPGVLFSEGGARLGRGAGFYDRWLGEHPGTAAIGLAFEVQVMERLPLGGRDVLMRMVVTERRVIEVGRPA